MLEWHKAFSCACLQGADPSYRLGICASVFLPALECKPLPFLLVCVVFTARRLCRGPFGARPVDASATGDEDWGVAKR